MNDHPRVPARREGGFSLLEVIIAATILFTIIAIAGRFLRDSNNLLTTISVRNETEVKAADLADRIARELRNASAQSFKPWWSSTPQTAPYYYEQYNGATFQNFAVRIVTDYNGQAILGDEIFYYFWNYTGQYESSYNDGIDNDKDGRTDEINFGKFVYPVASCFASRTDPTENPLWTGAVKYTKMAELAYYYSPPASNAVPDWNQAGIQFTLNGKVLSIRVKMLKYDPVVQKQVVVTAESAVKFRN